MTIQNDVELGIPVLVGMRNRHGNSQGSGMHMMASTPEDAHQGSSERSQTSQHATSNDQGALTGDHPEPSDQDRITMKIAMKFIAFMAPSINVNYGHDSLIGEVVMFRHLNLNPSDGHKKLGQKLQLHARNLHVTLKLISSLGPSSDVEKWEAMAKDQFMNDAVRAFHIATEVKADDDREEKGDNSGEADNAGDGDSKDYGDREFRFKERWSECSLDCDKLYNNTASNIPVQLNQQHDRQEDTVPLLSVKDKLRCETGWPDWVVCLWMLLAPFTYPVSFLLLAENAEALRDRLRKSRKLTCIGMFFLFCIILYPLAALVSAPVLLSRIGSLVSDNEMLRRQLDTTTTAIKFWLASAFFAIVNAAFVYLVSIKRNPVLLAGLSIPTEQYSNEQAAATEKALPKHLFDLSLATEKCCVFLQFLFFVKAMETTSLLLGNLNALVKRANMMGQWGDRYAVARWLEDCLSHPVIMNWFSCVSVILFYSIPRDWSYRAVLFVLVYVELLGCFVTIYRLARTFASLVLAAQRVKDGGIVGAAPGACEFVRTKLYAAKADKGSSSLITVMKTWESVVLELKGLRQHIDLTVYGKENQFSPDELTYSESNIRPPTAFRLWDRHFCFPLGDFAFFRAIFQLHNDGNHAVYAEFFYESTLLGADGKRLCEELWDHFSKLRQEQVVHAYRTYFFNLRAYQEDVTEPQLRVIREHINQHIDLLYTKKTMSQGLITFEKSSHDTYKDSQRDGSLFEMLREIENIQNERVRRYKKSDSIDSASPR